VRLHHAQVSVPAGGEGPARRFYRDGLGMTEVEKPGSLRARGGAWFRAYDAAGGVAAELHVGVEEPFQPALRAHPALMAGSVAELDATTARLVALGFTIDLAERRTLPDCERVHAFEAHGNRVELLAETGDGSTRN